MPGPEMVPSVRVVATPAALDRLVSPSPVLRLAPDEALVLGTEPLTVDDPSAIVEPEHGYAGVRLDRQRLDAWLATAAMWRLPPGRSAFAQGMAAGLPVKVWANDDDALLLVPAVLAHELEERL